MQPNSQTQSTENANLLKINVPLAQNEQFSLDAPQLAAWQRLAWLNRSLQRRRLWFWLQRYFPLWLRRLAHYGMTRLARPQTSIYLFGSVGRGKTMLMERFFNLAAVAPSRKRRVHFYSFMIELHRQFQQLSVAQTDSQIQSQAPSNAPILAKSRRGYDPLETIVHDLARKLDLLCFDEFVINNIVDAMILGRFLPKLLECGVVVVATSNFAPKYLGQSAIGKGGVRGGSRAAAGSDSGGGTTGTMDSLLIERLAPAIRLLEARFALVDLGEGRDWRSGWASGSQVWMTPPDPRRADAIWQAIAARQKTEAERQEQAIDLTVVPSAIAKSSRIVSRTATPTRTKLRKPRSIIIARTIGKAARFDFDQLCRVAFGPMDYLAIAERFDLVLLENVPQFSREDHNAARRFMILVDALYEAKAQLIVTAAVIASELYPDSPAPAEFRRTISRLTEFQSLKYQQAVPSA